jgi:hypothetical protein
VVCYFQGFSIICLDIYSDQDKIYSAICKLDVYGEGDPVSGEGGSGVATQNNICFCVGGEDKF